jgi:hypothetical protein
LASPFNSVPNPKVARNSRVSKCSVAAATVASVTISGFGHAHRPNSASKALALSFAAKHHIKP